MYSFNDHYTKLFLRANLHYEQLFKYLEEKSFGASYLRINNSDDSIYLYLGDHPRIFVDDVIMPWIHKWVARSVTVRSVEFIPHENSVLIKQEPYK